MDTPLSQVANMPTNSSFDPYTQWFEITLIDGTSKMEASVAHINTLRRLGVWVAISQGAQIGAAAILLTAIVLMTKSAKRRSWVFILNALSLLLVVIRGIFQLAVVTGPFYEFFRWETNHYADIGHAKAVSVCGEVSAFLLTLAIEVSLFLQVRIVCCNLSNPRRVLVNLFNGLLISAAVCMRFVVMVLSVHWGIINLEKQGEEQFQLINKTASAANICLVISIGMSTIIFTAKLALAIRSRRSMGMKQFGPMQIIFIMGCQTMFTPLIFTFITYWGIRNANVQSFVPTVVAITLPLSGMWAAVNTDNIHVARPDPTKHRVIPVGASGNTYDRSMSEEVSMNTASTLIDDDPEHYKGLTSSPAKSGTTTTDSDLEMQKLGNNVQVQRSYSVRSD